MNEDDAAAAVLRHLEPARAFYEPVVVRVEDAGAAWRVFYNNREYVEGGKASAALAGNWPFLVNKETGDIEQDEAFRRDFLRLDDE